MNQPHSIWSATLGSLTGGLLTVCGRVVPQEPPTDILTALTSDEARRRILDELPDSAVFGAQFRMNAGRALLLPRMRGMKRMPFWLQRLRARDLLALVRRFDNFPIVAETTRDCLRDVFDLPHLTDVLDGIKAGRIEIATIHSQTPSPVARGLLYSFVSIYMYQWDEPKAERQLRALSAAPLSVEAAPLDSDWTGRLSPEAIAEVVGRAGHSAEGSQARSKEELALIVRELGDLTEAEIQARCVGGGDRWLAELVIEKRILPITISGEGRWVSAELAEAYGRAPNVTDVVLRRLRWCGPITAAELLARYPFAELDLMPEDIGISVSYPLPGTKFYDRVKDDLQQKANWTDSNDLAMMFRSTYSPEFYRQLHRYIHKLYRKQQGLESLKRFFVSPLKLSGLQLRRMLMLSYFIPVSWWNFLKLNFIVRD